MTRRPVSARVGAGFGKSRITAELEGRLHAELHIRLRYFCSPYHQDSPLFPFVLDRSTKAVLEVMARGPSLKPRYSLLAGKIQGISSIRARRWG